MHLDRRWREIIENIPITANMGEFLIMKFLVQNQTKLSIINQYPYIYGYNFPLDPRYPEIGKIDLLLVDSNMNFLAIKIKYFGGSSGSNEEKNRKKERNEIDNQASTFAKKFKAAHPDYIIDSLLISDESFELDYKDFYIDFKNFMDVEWKKALEIYKE